MKKLIALITALCLAATAGAAPKKDDKAKDGKDKKKEAPVLMWDLVIEGATADTATQEVKALLADVKGLKVDSIESKEGTINAVVSSGQRFSRSDISRALRPNKALKVKDFKSKKPEKEGDKKDAEKKEGDKPADPEKKTEPKEGDKKDEEMTEDKKATDKKEGDKKPADPAGDAKKEVEKKTGDAKKETDAVKKDATSKLDEVKKDAPAKEEK
jgi:hypothetical protein